MDSKIQPKLSKLDFPHSPPFTVHMAPQKTPEPTEPTEPTKPRPLTRTHRILRSGDPLRRSRCKSTGRWEPETNGGEAKRRHSLDTIPGPPPGSESLGPTTKPKESPPRKLKKKDTSSSKPPFYGVLRFCVVRIFCFSSPQLPKKWASTKLPHPIQESPNMS